jgi:hypothetical protein
MSLTRFRVNKSYGLEHCIVHTGFQMSNIDVAIRRQRWARYWHKLAALIRYTF